MNNQPNYDIAMGFLQRQNKEYLEKIVKQNEKIIKQNEEIINLQNKVRGDILEDIYFQVQKLSDENKTTRFGLTKILGRLSNNGSNE